MITIKKLNIQNKPCYIFNNMTNINDFDHKEMLDKYVKVIDEIKKEILLTFEDDLLVMGKGSVRFRFKTNGNLPYNQKINAKICEISISSVFNEGWYYAQIELQECFYESNEN